MQKMEQTFLVLQYIGLWRPVHWPPGWKTNLYNSYTSFIIFAVVAATISEFIAFIMFIDDFEQFITNSSMVFTMILDSGKAMNILIKREEIIQLTNVLEKDPCRPKTEEEFAIQWKFDRLVRSLTLRYGVLVGSAACALALRSFVQDLSQRALPYKAWLPFDYYESSLGYSVAYTTEILGLIIGGAVGVAFDTLLPGLMLQTCAQLNILKQRFHDMPQLLLNSTRDRDKSNLSISTLESKLLSHRVTHHLEICKFAETSNNVFSLMIFLQCTVSAAILCLALFQLAKIKLLSLEFTGLLMFAAVMSTQLFLYCFYGCQVTFESQTVSNAIYAIDWPLLSPSAQRSLITIMARTLRPIQFISGHFVTLNLDSFNSVIKLSYSAYNVLQQSQE